MRAQELSDRFYVRLSRLCKLACSDAYVGAQELVMIAERLGRLIVAE